MKSEKEMERIIKEFYITADSEMDKEICDDVSEVMKRRKQTKLASTRPNIWRIALGSKAGYLAATFLIISSWVTCFVLSRKVTDLRDELAQREVAIARTDDSATINLYLREHQDVVARTASLNLSHLQPVRMHVSRRDILYYEFLDDRLEFMRPGIIVRGSSSQRKISSSEAPAISNGHALTLSQARKTVNFHLVSPLWLYPGYMLDKIRKIEDRDALHLLYTDGINTISLFEQPLDGERGLVPQDFREYAVYRNKGQVVGTILAWRDDALSYVLIGNTEMSQLMDMAQSISAAK